MLAVGVIVVTVVFICLELLCQSVNNYCIAVFGSSFDIIDIIVSKFIHVRIYLRINTDVLQIIKNSVILCRFICILRSFGFATELRKDCLAAVNHIVNENGSCLP